MKVGHDQDTIPIDHELLRSKVKVSVILNNTSTLSD